MSGWLRKSVLTGLMMLGAGFVVATAGSPASAAPAQTTARPAAACATASCCTCTKKKVTKSKKATVTITQSTQDTVNARYTFMVDINPNLSGSKSYKYKVQQLVTTNGIDSWVSLGTYRSRGKQETGTHTVGAGTYRVVVYGTRNCGGKAYSARFVEPAAATTPNTAVSDKTSTGTGSGTSSGTGTGTSSGTTVTNIYITQPAASASPSTSPPVTPQVEVTVPAVVTGVNAVLVNPLSALVSWTPPSSNGGAAIIAYRVTDSVSGLWCQASPPATSCTISGLTAGTSYSFTVVAYNSQGWSVPSAPSNVILAVTTPNAPTNVQAVRTDRGATVSWRAPVFDGGAKISKYIVTTSDGTCTTDGALTCKFTGLINTASYTFFVQAFNSVGASVVSTDSNTLAPVTAPDPVTNLAAESVGTSVKVTWTASVSDGGLGPVVYHIQVGPNEYTTSSTSWSGTMPAGSYSATVWATNPVGMSSTKTSCGFQTQ